MAMGRSEFLAFEVVGNRAYIDSYTHLKLLVNYFYNFRSLCVHVCTSAFFCVHIKYTSYNTYFSKKQFCGMRFFDCFVIKFP